MSYEKKQEKLPGSLTLNNEELQKLLASSERLASLRTRRRPPNILKRIREQAGGLYSVLANVNVQMTQYPRDTRPNCSCDNGSSCPIGTLELRRQTTILERS